MTKILKKVPLSTEQSTPKSADPTKGIQANPFTQEEMTALQEEGAWEGGYVEGLGYVAGLRGDPEQHASPSIVYPDDGTVIYPGIYVPRGSYNANHAHLDPTNHFETQVHLSWQSGYTGIGSGGIVPDWWQSNIAAAFTFLQYIDEDILYEIDGPVLPNIFWKKISNGIYSIGIKFKYYCKKYNRNTAIGDEEEWIFEDSFMGSIDTEIPYDPDLKRGYPLNDD